MREFKAAVWYGQSEPEKAAACVLRQFQNGWRDNPPVMSGFSILRVIPLPVFSGAAQRLMQRPLNRQMVSVPLKADGMFNNPEWVFFACLVGMYDALARRAIAGSAVFSVDGGVKAHLVKPHGFVADGVMGKMAE